MAILPNLGKNERWELIQEVFLVLSQNKKVIEVDTPKKDFFLLSLAILSDDGYRCNVTELMVQALKKSPVWNKILPFLVRSDSHCRTPKCDHGAYDHKGGDWEVFW